MSSIPVGTSSDISLHNVVLVIDSGVKKTLSGLTMWREITIVTVDGHRTQITMFPNANQESIIKEFKEPT